MKEYKIHFNQEQMEDLYRRIRRTRLPEALGAENWRLGMDDDYLSSLLTYWSDGYD